MKMRRLALSAVAASLALGSLASAQENRPPVSPQDARPIAIVPKPASLKAGSGAFTLSARTVIWTDQASRPIARRLAAWLEPATGLVIPVRAGAGTGAGRIVLARDRTLKALGAEGYRLDVTPSRVAVRAPELAGLFYGLQSLRQLLPAEIFREAKVEGVKWTMPAVSIEDKPRFSWRGGHLDVCRHFMPKEFVKKYIDLLALHKMNTFHWHLTDDQGWRIEIREYPKLTEVGAWRKESIVGRQSRNQERQFDATRHGGFYTQGDVREIVAYAKDRFVNVVPEVEMPGHAIAAIASYPELGVDASGTEVATTWGVFDNILNAEDATVGFMQDVLTEVMELFPSPFIHVGGDEAAKGRWKASTAIQARIAALGAKDEDGLQSWFITQMDRFLTSKGRRLIGWDEILEGGLAPGAAVMSWRGTKGGIAAAQEGHDVVMTPTSHTYFDYYQSKDQAAEPLAIGGFVPLETAYAFDPVPPDLPAEFARHVLGSQGQLWTEYLKDPKQVEYMAFPRMAALAEVVWTPAATKDFTDFSARLDEHVKRLSILDVNFRAIRQ